MKKINYFILAVLMISACKKITPGYLETDGGQYSTDSLVVRKELSDTLMFEADYDRKRLNIPWVSTPMEGIMGTAQIKIGLKDITSQNGDAAMLKSIIFVRGDGTISVPLKNNLPVGRYLISLNISNEGYSRELNNIFKVIVISK
ncbi:hypothetical protein [Pedobacter sp. MC2016-24]|uniref:hypothetical protein n=1 Tax=Pedobacter sp. MC2016-24 TaxID=2780090 RepID=UPI0018807BB4|nr:hypothetical protein [Pedobacter sp. MC2016-24]MBE9601575.1 hypothetical protein [Pedobacter sp. MC2016-24]